MVGCATVLKGKRQRRVKNYIVCIGARSLEPLLTFALRKNTSAYQK